MDHRHAIPLLLALTACNQLTRIGGGDTACVPEEVQAAFDRSCATGGCHDAAGAAAGLVLSGDASGDVLVRDASQTALPLVLVGDTGGSYLAHKLMADPPTAIVGARMPVGFDPSNADQVADVTTILAWIAGAPMTGCSSGGTDTTTGEPPGDLPCDVEELLATRCRSCHGETPAGNAPMSLVTRDDLLAQSAIDPQLDYAERSAIRMADTISPMPPAPAMAVSAAELAAFEAWIADGSPIGSCTPTTDPFAVTQCTSDVYWRGDEGSPQMYPGRDCISCHTRERAEGEDEAPDLLVAGTIYPTGHEPDDCKSTALSPDLRVLVRSMVTGDELQLTPGSAGNFLLHRSAAPAGFAAPFTVKLVDGTTERTMAMAAPNGDCNACHTQPGATGAPGRVVAP